MQIKKYLILMSNQVLKTLEVISSNVGVGVLTSGNPSYSRTLKLKNITANYLNVIGTTTSGTIYVPRCLKVNKIYTTSFVVDGTAWSPYTPPTIINNSFISVFTSLSSFSYTTTTPNELVYIVGTIYSGGSQTIVITGIDGFTQRGTYVTAGAINFNYTVSAWYAIIATPGTYSPTITFTSPAGTAKLSIINVTDFNSFGIGTSTTTSGNTPVPVVNTISQISENINTINTTSSRGTVLLIYYVPLLNGPATDPNNAQLITYSSTNDYTTGYYNFSSAISSLNLLWNTITVSSTIRPVYIVDLLV